MTTEEATLSLFKTFVKTGSGKNFSTGLVLSSKRREKSNEAAMLTL